MPTLMQGNNPIGVINKSGGGHVIQDASGTAVAQEPNMQFTDAHVSDDPTNDKTEVEVIKSVASADYSSETEDGLYLIPDGEGSVIGPESEDKKTVSASNDTWNTVLMKLYTLIDFNKIKEVSIFSIKSGTSEKFFNISSYDDTNKWLEFTCISEYISTTSETVYLRPSNACYYFYNGTNISNDSVAKDTLITLYYGNKKAVVDLQTTANRCWYDSNNTVKQKIDTKADTSNIVSGSVLLPYANTYYCQKDITIPNNAKVVASFLYGTGAYNKTSGIMVQNIDVTTSRIIAFSSGGSYVSGDSVGVNYIAVKS